MEKLVALAVSPLRPPGLPPSSLSFACVLALLLAGCASRPDCGDRLESRDLCEAVRAADVVFFGEEHDDRGQHAFQREILDLVGAASEGAPVLLGMEMFQRPFQEPLDEYAARRIDEKEMLRRTEYFTRWSFDWTLYAPLWRWCREHGARIVALNADGAITRKVGRQGLAALTAQERGEIPREIDLSDVAHRDRIMTVFSSGAHPLPADQLQRYYEAMTVWDETMAESAAAALSAAGPGARMLVVAGRNHVEDGTGIPDRLARRLPNLRRVVVLGETGEAGQPPSIRHERGQFVVPFAKDAGPPAPKLGITFEPQPTAEGLRVKSATPGGAGETAGILAGDVLVNFAGEPVRDIADVRYVVDASRTGDRVAAVVLRDGGSVGVTITLAPAPPPPVVAPKP